MRTQVVGGLIVTAFAVAVGHLAWHTRIGPPALPKYFVGGDVPVLTGTDPSAKQLYLRRELYLSRPPLHAWIQVLTRDRVGVYVNGALVADKTLDGFPVAVLADLTAYLRPGPNVIAIAARQATVGRPPAVAVEGAYVLDDGEHRIGPDDRWRCQTAFERGAYWWFSPDFKDRHWPIAQIATANLRASVEVPPRAITTPSDAPWITPSSWADGGAGFRGTFEVPGRPRHAWLRVTTPSAYRLAVNGVPLDQQEDQLATTAPVPVVRRTYDVTALVQRGGNCLSFVLTDTFGPPHLQADVEVEDQSGRHSHIGTDGAWLSRPGLPEDWLRTSPEDTTSWQPCAAEAGNLNVLPWQIRHKIMEASLPFPVRLWRGGEQAAVMLVVGLLTLLACRFAGRRVAGGRTNSFAPVVYLALVLPTLAIVSGILATHDPRIGSQDVYQDRWLFLAIVSVPLQWLALSALALIHTVRWKAFSCCIGAMPTARALWIPALLAGLMLMGFGLRFRHLETEPMHWDEVEVYRNTIGFLKSGFPSVEPHPDAPRLAIHTSELLFVSTGLAALVFEDDRYVVRFPAVCWGVLSIGLTYLVGRRLFGVVVGLSAAAVLTVAPVCIAMSTFGRYFAQLQFLTLLTAYCFWLTVRGSGPIKRRALWATAASFIATYLTWEGSALIAPALVAAALLHRRGRLHTIIGAGAVWLAMLTCASAILLQNAHLMRVQSQFLWCGISLSDVTLKAMWRLPIFQPWYYVWESSWNQDTFLPLLGLLGAALLTIRHPWRRQTRFLMLIYLGNCLVMVLLLPNTKWRYVYQAVPFLILLSAAALTALTRGLVNLVRRGGRVEQLAYARAVALGTVATAVALGSGLTVHLAEMPRFAVEGYSRLFTYQFPNLDGPARFLRQHAQEGDAILGNDLQHVHYLMRLPGRADRRPEPDRSTDYWLSSTLFLPAMLDDRRALPLDRRDGSVLVPNRESLEDLFARHRRVWYVVQPGMHQAMNTPDVSTFLRQHMEVVYEDWQTLVLFRDGNHRPAAKRQEDEQTLQRARANFLP